MEENKQIQKAEPSADIDISKANQKLAAMMAFMKANLRKGIDYMTIPGANRPSLLKSGAEKMNILMGLSAQYEKVKEVMNPRDSFYYVEVKCVLRHIKTGTIVAEGLASCNSQEKARKMLAFADSLNTVLKIAEKRAYVGATLNANALSQFYTQDLEDEIAEKSPKNAAFFPKTAQNPPKTGLFCSKCRAEITQKVRDYSLSKYAMALCMGCQDKK